jgi:hypothetical protein
MTAPTNSELADKLTAVANFGVNRISDPERDWLLVAAERLMRLDADNHRMRLGDMSTYDYDHLIAWIQDAKRKDPSGAFTAGAARTAAHAIERSGIFDTATRTTP